MANDYTNREINEYIDSLDSSERTKLRVRKEQNKVIKKFKAKWNKIIMLLGTVGLDALMTSLIMGISFLMKGDVNVFNVAPTALIVDGALSAIIFYGSNALIPGTFWGNMFAKTSIGGEKLEKALEEVKNQVLKEEKMRSESKSNQSIKKELDDYAEMMFKEMKRISNIKYMGWESDFKLLNDTLNSYIELRKENPSFGSQKIILEENPEFLKTLNEIEEKVNNYLKGKEVIKTEQQVLEKLNKDVFSKEEILANGGVIPSIGEEEEKELLKR